MSESHQSRVGFDQLPDSVNSVVTYQQTEYRYRAHAFREEKDALLYVMHYDHTMYL